jgi:chromate transporter
MTPTYERHSIAQVAYLFLKLGTIGFGGPAAHIAFMREEVVARRKWLTDQRFLDLVGATNLIPGPNSTELAIHIGRERAGWKGLIIAGVAFIAPAMIIVLALAWLYVRYGSTPEAQSLLYGITPVIVAIIAVALWHLTKSAAKGVLLGALWVAVFALYLVGVNELLLLAAAALLYMTVEGWRRRGFSTASVMVGPALVAAASERASADLLGVLAIFLKFGSVVFGSGYVLLAFLRGDLVTRLGWLTASELVDAVAIGQVTPGPVFTTATFIGYLVAGLPGALVATVGIFLPSFVFVALLNPLVTKMRQSFFLSAALDGLNAGAVGLMAGVTTQIGRVSLIDPLTIAVAVSSLLVLIRWRANSALLVIGGALVGLGRVFLA